MNEKVLRVVEFDKIISQLTEHADSAPGKARCQALQPMEFLSDIDRAQAETEEALSYIFRQSSISFGSNSSVNNIITCFKILKLIMTFCICHCTIYDGRQIIRFIQE